MVRTYKRRTKENSPRGNCIRCGKEISTWHGRKYCHINCNVNDWEWKNKDKVRAKDKRIYAQSKEKIKARSKKHYEENKELRGRQVAEYVRKKYREDEAFRNRRKLGSALGSVIRYYIKTGRISNPLPKFGIDWKGIMKVLTPIPQPRKDYNVDHIIPLYKFDLSDIEQIQLAFAPENHRWMLAKENMARDRPGTKASEKNKFTRSPSGNITSSKGEIK